MSSLDKMEQLTRIQTMNSLNARLISGGDNIIYCSWCGGSMKRKESILCQDHSRFLRKGIIICHKCAKRCKDCGKYFCPKHIDNHKCKK